MFIFNFLNKFLDFKFG